MSSYGVRDLTEGKIFKQLISQALPIMASGFVQMAYTITDMAWLGRLGSREIAAVGGMGIILWFVESIALLTKVGAEINIAQSIGLKDFERAKSFASHTITLASIIGILAGVALFVFANPIISIFRFDTGLTGMARDYLLICCISQPAVFLFFTFSGIYNGVGRTSVPFYFLAIGLACNMLLCPLFIFGINGHLALGVKGAGIATVTSQWIVALLFIWKLKRKNAVLDGFPFFVKLRKNYTRSIVKLGLPIAAMNCLFSTINYYIAGIASVWGGYLGVMSQTTGSQIEGLTWYTASGFSTALSTFTAQNFARNKIKRAIQAYKYTLIVLLSLGFLISCVFLFAGKELFGLFVIEEKARLAGAGYLFVMGFCQLFMMLEIATAGLWNGFGRTTYPAAVSITFNILRIPLALLLTPHYGVNGVWIAIAVSAGMKGIISPVWWLIVYWKNDFSFA
ncbi:MAG: MATE family efflux transporter [Dysgonamonadaceae bacterium]|jgi:putative MATE family efflux protein|nr:MATE family efflux transporter [Dysgonamonadaceae bacterium]